MKRIYFTFFISIFSTLVFCQGIEFFDGTWEDAKLLAESEEKLLFVDAYAQWCGPCKRMAKQVFTNPSVGEYYNENFINLKIDMEKGMGLSFREDYPVSAFPTLFYIDAKGEIVKKVVGGRSAKEFIDLGKSVILAYDRSGDLAVQYEEGNRDFAFILKYVKALNRADKSSLKISNEFLRNNKDLGNEQKAEFLFEALTHADSRIFSLFIDQREMIESIKGRDAVESKIEAACWNTIHNAMDFEVPELLVEARIKMKDNCSSKALQFAIESEYEYAKAVDNTGMMMASAMKMAKDLLSDKPDELYLLAEDIFLYKSMDPEAINTSEKIIIMALKESENIDYYLTYTQILLAQNNKKKAIKNLNKALKLAGRDEKRSKEIRDLINEINAT